MSINSRYDELVRIAGACMDKDREIHTLRSEINDLTTQLNTAKENEKYYMNLNKSSCKSDDKSYGSLSSIEEGQDFNFWTMFKSKEGKSNNNPSSNQSRASKEKPENMTVEDASALKGVNEMLRRELESACYELNATKRQLAEEMERSAQDMEAFAEALRGVDELRNAAEMMSRELTRMKKKKKKWGSYRNIAEFDMEEDDDDTVISMGTHQLEDAKKSIQNVLRSEDKNPIWNKIKKEKEKKNEVVHDSLAEDGIPRFAVFNRRGSVPKRMKQSEKTLESVGETIDYTYFE